MTVIPRDQLLILETIVEVYDSRPKDVMRRIWHSRSARGAQMQPWPDDGPVVDRGDLEELSDRGLIDIDFNNRGDYLVKPTPEGRDAIAWFARQRARAQNQESVDLSWSAMRPVLHAIVTAWGEAGAPMAGYLPLHAIAENMLGDDRPSNGVLDRMADVLAEGEWIVIVYDEPDDPVVQPTMRGVMATQGWPGGDGEVAAERLLSVLDDLAANAPSPEKRKWAERMREGMMELGVKTLAEVVSKSVGTAV